MKTIKLLPFFLFSFKLLADLAVTPPILQYKGSDKFNEITIKNTSEKDRLFDISIKKWTQVDGKDIYDDTTDLVVMPMTTKVSPNSEKMIRVILKNPSAKATQNSYRLFIREAPSGKKKVTKGTAFEFLFRIIVPVFTHGNGFAAQENLDYSAKLDTAKNVVAVTVTNLGNTVALFSNVRAPSISNASYKSARYILHGSSYTWEFPLKDKINSSEFLFDFLLNEKPSNKSLVLPSQKSRK